MELIEPTYYRIYHTKQETPQQLEQTVRAVQESFVRWGIEVECKRKRNNYTPPSVDEILTPGVSLRVYSSLVKTREDLFFNKRRQVIEFLNVRDRDNHIGDKRIWHTVLSCVTCERELEVSIYRECTIPGARIEHTFPIDYLEEPTFVPKVRDLLGIEREYPLHICDTQASVDACEQELSQLHSSVCKLVLSLDAVTPDVVAYWRAFIPDCFETYLVSQEYMTSDFWYEVPFRQFVSFTPYPQKAHVLYGRGLPLQDIQGIKIHLAKLMHLTLVCRLREITKATLPWQPQPRREGEPQHLKLRIKKLEEELGVTKEELGAAKKDLGAAEELLNEKDEQLRQSQSVNKGQQKIRECPAVEFEPIDMSVNLQMSADIRAFLMGSSLWPNLICSEKAKKSLEDFVKDYGRDKTVYTPQCLHHAFSLLNYVLFPYYNKAVAKKNVMHPADVLAGDVQQVDLEESFTGLAKKHTGETSFKFAKTENAHTKNDPAAQTARQFFWKGKVHYAWPHLKLGTTLRIYFEYLSEERKLYIHHCGKHLPTWNSKKNGSRR